MKNNSALVFGNLSNGNGLILVAFFAAVFSFGRAHSQCQPYVKIDGNLVTANEGISNGTSLPIWLKAGQTLAIGSMVTSISVIEFAVNGSALEFSQVLNVTSGTVPANHVWKVESFIKPPSFGTTTSGSFTSSGTYQFAVPYCANNICIEVWGGGGGGGGNNAGTSSNAGGGGGGGYGQQCFSVTPGAVYSVVVGTAGTAGASGNSGGAGGASSVTGPGVSISASGGAGGGCCFGGSGGAGGTSSASVNVFGDNGLSGLTTGWGGGTGGYGGNGGKGGASNASNSQGGAGTAPGGGGGGGGYNQGGGAGSVGKVSITW